MVLATLQSLRRFTLSHTNSCRAFNTSVVAREGTRPFKLPEAKLRALITLYHRSSSFITPANLSSRIDSAFTGTSSIIGSSGTYSMEYRVLEAQVLHKRERTTPKSLNYRNVPLNNFDPTTWSGVMRGERQALVSATLWGIKVGGRPSLETVQETSATNKESGDLLDQTVNPHRL